MTASESNWQGSANLARHNLAVARTPDFYRLPILPDPSLAIMERRGIWGMGGVFVLAAILLAALVLRLDQMGRAPLGPAEACIWRDWQKPTLAIAGRERREILAPLYHVSLRLWGKVGSSDEMLRLHSTLWGLVLVAIVFGLGASHYSRGIGALAGILLAVSPPLVSFSQQIGPATQAATCLLLNFSCLMQVVFRQPRPMHWLCYLVSGVAAILCHPVSIWVILAQALLALFFGPSAHRSGFSRVSGSREEMQVFYSRLAFYGLIFAIVGWIWFRSTRSLDPAAEFGEFGQVALWADWGLPTDSGVRVLIRLLGVESLWGTRIFPSGWLWIASSVVLATAPLVYGGFVIRQRHLQEMGSFILLGSVGPLALVVLLQGRLIETHCHPTEVLVLVLAPLALWASASVRLGLRERPRQILTSVLIVGGVLVTLWSSRIEAYPNWQIYRDELNKQLAEGRVVLADGVARLADFELYLGSRVRIDNLETAAEVRPTRGKELVLLSPLSPLYKSPERRGSLAPVIRDWLQGRQSKLTAVSLEAGGFFRITLWTDFNQEDLRDFIGRATFFNPPTAWHMLRPVRWFGPGDPGYERLGPTTRLVDSQLPVWPTSASSDFGELSRAVEPSSRQVTTLGRSLVGAYAQWVFSPGLPEGYYHVFIPVRPRTEDFPWRVRLLWTLPNGQRRLETVTKETRDVSFIWKTASPNEQLKIAVLSLGDDLAGGPSPRRRRAGQANGPPVVFFGVGVRRHFPYVVDIGAPFDDMALGRGWNQAEHDGEVTYRWTEARAFLTFHLPEPSDAASNWELALRVARRTSVSSEEPLPGTPSSVKFEVLWDGQKLPAVALAPRKSSAQAGQEWTTVRLPLPAPPTKGSHEVEITSPIFYVPDPADPKHHIRRGIMVDNVAIESSGPLFSVPP